MPNYSPEQKHIHIQSGSQSMLRDHEGLEQDEQGRYGCTERYLKKGKAPLSRGKCSKDRPPRDVW